MSFWGGLSSRARLGLLVPATNVTMEDEWRKAAPEGVCISVARMYKHLDVVWRFVETGKTNFEEMEEIGKRITFAKPDVIMFGCTSGSFVGGVQYDRDLAKTLREAAGDIPVITTSQAVTEAIKEMKMKRIMFVTPYDKKTNERGIKFFESVIPNLKVLKDVALREDFKDLTKENYLKYMISNPYTSYIASKETDSPEVDGCFISDTMFRTFEIIDTLERDLGKPVVTSNQASLWAALKAVKINDSVKGYGKLLEKPRII